MPSDGVLRVRPLESDERPWLRERLTRLWGAPEIANRGRVLDASLLPALVCVEGEEIVRLATFELGDAGCELVTLDAFADGRGIGTTLLEAVAGAAREQRDEIELELPLP